MKTFNEMRAALTGPIASIRTPFKKNGDIDYRALGRMVEFDIAAGSGALLLTAGDSLYTLLFPEEIADVTRAVVRQAAGRAMVVAADNNYATPMAVEFAKFARKLGADMYMVKPPEWIACNTPETLLAHYAAVAKHIPVMLVTNVYSSRGHKFGLKVVEMVRDQVPGVVAVKDDICGEFGRRMAMLVRDRWIVFSGGQKQNHLDIYPYGCDSYLSTFITLKPELAHRYWKALTGGDMPAAVAVIRDYEAPFFDIISSLPGGFDAGMHGALELFRLAGRWRRPPFYSLNNEEMERLADSFKRLGLTKR